MPSPSPSPSPSRGLMFDLINEILTRLPPDEPGCLFRASLVCKLWRDLLTSDVFARSYRKFHGTPPLLGFFENRRTFNPWFAPSSLTSPIPPLLPDSRDLLVLDARHGLVLLRNPISTEHNPTVAVSLVVWDPLRGRQWEFPPPDFAKYIDHDEAVVLCATQGCDHINCRGFLVGYVGTDHTNAYASVYSLETNSWSNTLPCPYPDIELYPSSQLKPLVGKSVYLICHYDPDELIILRFDMLTLELSIFDGPPVYKYDLMTTEEGGLGASSESRSLIHMWSTETRPDGAVAWVERKVIDLQKLLRANLRSVHGFADGVGVVSTDQGIITIDVKSGRVKKMSINNTCDFPFISFYTPDQAGPKTCLSLMASCSESVEVAHDEYRDPPLLRSRQQLGSKEGGGWEEVGDKQNDGAEEFAGVVDCQRGTLQTSVARHGKLSPKCCTSYYNLGCALLRKAQANQDSKVRCQDLALAWRMLHVSRGIYEKSPGTTMEKYKIFAALAKVSVEIDENDYSLYACFKALAILEHLLEPEHRHFIKINLPVRFSFELESKVGDAKAIAFCKSRVENLKGATEALLAVKGDDESATEVESATKDIQFLTRTILSALDKKLEDLEQPISTPVSEASGGANLEVAAGQGVEQAWPKEMFVEDDSSDSSDVDSDSDSSVSE